MLKNIEHSRQENIFNPDIASIHEMVADIKKRKEVGIYYMKSWEREQFIRREGLEEGLEEGLKKGREEALNIFQTAIDMKKQGIDNQLIAEKTGLPLSLIESLK